MGGRGASSGFDSNGSKYDKNGVLKNDAQGYKYSASGLIGSEKQKKYAEDIVNHSLESLDKTIDSTRKTFINPGSSKDQNKEILNSINQQVEDWINTKKHVIKVANGVKNASQIIDASDWFKNTQSLMKAIRKKNRGY